MLRFPAESPAILALVMTNRPYLGEWLRFSEAQWIRDRGVKTVIDIGAYTGSLCFGIAKLIPDARIYAFDPLPANFAKLQVLANDIDLFPFNVAVGNQEGQGTFYRNAFSASSSALTMAQTHADEFPETAHSEEIPVPFWRLDEHLKEFDVTGTTLMVLDVQGYEFEVLQGSEQLLADVDIVICEISVEVLYEQQASFHDIYTWLTDRGFYYSGDFDRLMSPVDGRVLQVDAIFDRRTMADT
jgi:FkbM family methyltransferase